MECIHNIINDAEKNYGYYKTRYLYPKLHSLIKKYKQPENVGILITNIQEVNGKSISILKS